ncbi:hypothetical protein TMEN_1357 [Trichophyton mentagrophytes]|nr:hypothetical protein TMEN_1357 [Trichophyton mentagrophytes]
MPLWLRIKQDLGDTLADHATIAGVTWDVKKKMFDHGRNAHPPKEEGRN